MPKTYPQALTTYSAEISKFYIMDLRSPFEIFAIPFPPESLAETPNAPSFTSDAVLGRSSQLVTYTSSDNRTVAIQFTVLDDYVDKKLTEVRDILASFSMPKYDNFRIIEPSVQAKLGALVIRGVIASLSFNWSGVFRDGYWTKLDVNMTIKEARQIPLGSTEVRAGGLKNG
jgi:hypothetical protein